MSYTLLDDNKKKRFCSFGKREDPFGHVEWASNDSSIVLLMSCQCVIRVCGCRESIQVRGLPEAEDIQVRCHQAAVVRNNSD